MRPGVFTHRFSGRRVGGWVARAAPWVGGWVPTARRGGGMGRWVGILPGAAAHRRAAAWQGVRRRLRVCMRLPRASCGRIKGARKFPWVFGRILQNLFISGPAAPAYGRRRQTMGRWVGIPTRRPSPPRVGIPVSYPWVLPMGKRHVNVNAWVNTSGNYASTNYYIICIIYSVLFNFF